MMLALMASIIITLLLLSILYTLRELVALMREIAREKTHITFTTNRNDAARRHSVEGRANDY